MSGPAPPPREVEDAIATLGGRGALRLRRDAPNVRGAWGARSRPHRHRGRQRSVTATPGRSERAGGLGGPFEAPSPPWEAEERHGYAGALRTCGGLGGPVRGPIATVGGRGASRLRRGAPNVRGAWGARSRPHRHRG